MSKSLKIRMVIVLVVSLSFFSSLFAFDELQTIKATYLVSRYFSKMNYARVSIDDSFAKSALKSFLKTLDVDKLYFLKSDIDAFQKVVLELDDRFNKGDSLMGFEIYDIYRERVNRRIEFGISLLESGNFDFDRLETINLDSKSKKWATSTDEINSRSRQKVKLDYMNLMIDGLSRDKIVEDLKKRYKKRLAIINDREQVEVFGLYVNSFMHVADPHTSYMTPKGEKEFNSRMSLSLFGIGALLNEKDGTIEVVKPIQGGPAYKSGKVRKGDLIIGLAEGKKGKMEDIVGLSLEKAVERIKGPKGTVVRLKIKSKIEGKTIIVEIVRDKIDLKDQKAKGIILKNIDGKRIGVINIPTFYEDFAAKRRGEKGASVADDVNSIVADFKDKNIDGILVNLMNNGGGSLGAVIEMASIFIGDDIPAVYTKNSMGRKGQYNSSNQTVTYKGPLAVLINHYSASASEIFAGYIKDYRRGVIIGEGSFGKGTVQTIQDLNGNMLSNANGQLKDEDFGAIKVTISKFFRANGMSTQHRGVLPDVMFPSDKYVVSGREQFLDHSLSFEQLTVPSYDPLLKGSRGRIAYTPLNKEIIKVVDKKAQDRFKSNDFLTAQTNRQVFENSAEKNREVSLNIELFKVRKKNLEVDSLGSTNIIRTSLDMAPIASFDDFSDIDIREEHNKRIQREFNLIGARVLVDYMTLERR